MEKIRTFNNPLYGDMINYYSFSNHISVGDIFNIIDLLQCNDIKLHQFRLSNSQEQPDHFFRVFPSIEYLKSFDWDNCPYIDDFGISCSFSGVKFDLTFDFSKNQVFTISKGNINLESMLFALENALQKKTK